MLIYIFSNQEDDDMGVMGAEADDAESEFIRTVCEKVVETPRIIGSLNFPEPVSSLGACSVLGWSVNRSVMIAGIHTSMLLSEYFFNSQTALKNYAYFIFIPCSEDENQALYNFSTDFVPNSLLHVFLTSTFFRKSSPGTHCWTASHHCWLRYAATRSNTLTPTSAAAPASPLQSLCSCPPTLRTSTSGQEDHQHPDPLVKIRLYFTIFTASRTRSPDGTGFHPDRWMVVV